MDLHPAPGAGKDFESISMKWSDMEDKRKVKSLPWLVFAAFAAIEDFGATRTPHFCRCWRAGRLGRLRSCRRLSAWAALVQIFSTIDLEVHDSYTLSAASSFLVLVASQQARNFHPDFVLVRRLLRQRFFTVLTETCFAGRGRTQISLDLLRSMGDPILTPSNDELGGGASAVCRP